MVSVGTLSHLLTVAGTIRCSETEPLLKQITVAQLSECLLECSEMTYMRKLQLQDKRVIRFKDSTEGEEPIGLMHHHPQLYVDMCFFSTDLGEYCWSTEFKCTIGESFQHAYVVLPVGDDTLEVKATTPTATRLYAHHSPTTIAENCGLRYDVTPHFIQVDAGTSFCVQVVTSENVLGDNVLKCPPYLVTFWQRNQPNQGGGG